MLENFPIRWKYLRCLWSCILKSYRSARVDIWRAIFYDEAWQFHCHCILYENNEVFMVLQFSSWFIFIFYRKLVQSWCLCSFNSVLDLYISSIENWFRAVPCCSARPIDKQSTFLLKKKRLSQLHRSYHKHLPICWCQGWEHVIITCLPAFPGLSMHLPVLVLLVLPFVTAKT